MKNDLRLLAFLHANQSIRNKLLVSYLAFILVPITSITIFTYYLVSGHLENQLSFSARETFKQTRSYLEYKIKRVMDISNDIAFNNVSIQKLLSKRYNTYKDDNLQQYADYIELSNYFENLKQGDEVDTTAIYVKPNLLFSNENRNFFNLDKLEDTSVYLKLKEMNGIAWNGGEISSDDEQHAQEVISLYRLIIDKSNFESVLGVLKLSILEKNISSILVNAKALPSSYSFIVNKGGTVITSSEKNRNKDAVLFHPYYNTMLEQGIDWSEIEMDGKKLLIGCNLVKNTDWLLVSVVPYDEIRAVSIGIRNRMLIVLFVISLVSVITAILISFKSVERIKRLVRTMREVQSGYFTKVDESDTNDEICELEKNYNYMMQTITELTEERYRAGKEVKNLEMKALQAQINPHFLYNTLDLINWMSVRNKVPEISTLIQAMARYYKLSLSKGRDIVKLTDEIEHVKTYIEIQNRRFDNAIDLILDINDELYEYSIIKMLLQPIVENSILHGIMQKANKSGSIIITGWLENQCMVLQVRDDGVGITPEKVAGILEWKQTGDSHGYGIMNIHKRIQLFYGEEYGLYYESQTGEGTTVTIRIPAVQYVE